MNYLYLYLNIGSFLIPFLFSFHPKLQFYKKWRSLFIGIAVMMAFFIPWDVLFTRNGIWGFNDAYITGYKILDLPIEEWLFFICIPYACLFTHYSLQYFFPKGTSGFSFSFSENTTRIVYVVLQSVLIVSLWYFYDRWYTLVNFCYAILLLGLVYNYKRPLLSTFFPTFLVILLPFFFVNGVLTGSWIAEPVVWYDNTENMGLRVGTIPIEDSVYALGMLLTVLVWMQWREERK
ncbi:lycopene cyclase domain-containing protein [Altibacter sp.]|uniref:lycopene cyclase domain-containing protein n=1 Tax=Altibacter sp. TaxID=2024823 RepID=UPI000C8B5671|nr:lycopene cyclase domain-containing protein [Altibacter sp.]MAP55404.1 lycopene cyclase [Altibacter sp.]